MKKGIKKINGFIPIVLAIIIASSVLVVGGGSYTGFRYYQSNKLIKQAKTFTNAGKYNNAKNAYEKAARNWPSKYRKGLVESAKRIITDDGNYQKAIMAAKGNDFNTCVASLKKIDSSYPKYRNVTSVMNQCRENQTRVAEGQAPVSVSIEDQAVASITKESLAKSTNKTTSQADGQNKSTSNPTTSSASTNPAAASSQTTSGSSGSNNGSTAPSNPTTPTTPNNPPPQTIFGNYSTASVESIVNSLQLVYDDATGDYVTPPGGADPVHGVYEYAPVDIDNLYMGIHDGRLYFKVTLGGAISPTRQTINTDIIEGITFNIGVDSDGDLMEACATEAVFQLNIEYHSDGKIWYNSNSSANCTAGEMGTHTAVYEVSGHGLAHTYNSGLGKNSIVFSHPLSELAGMINVGSNLNVYVGSEAESNRWEHYSYDMNILAGEPVWAGWTAVGI